MKKLYLSSVKKQCHALKDPQQAQILQRFFKTAPGQYGHGDKFLGIKVPILRKIAKQHQQLTLEQCQELLQSSWHEYRFIALCLLIHKYKKSTTLAERKTIYTCYVNNIPMINNWDLVDISAPHIVGSHLLQGSHKILHRWAKHQNMWKRRIAIVSTFAFIRESSFDDTLIISKILFNDSQDLLHKAAGWMLREIGKRHQPTLTLFLQQHAHEMPRVMLRYAIEKYPESTRKRFLKKKLTIA